MNKNENIYNLLKTCCVEKDIEESYKRILSYYFPEGKISSPYRTDGILEDNFKMLMEFKYDIDLSKKIRNLFLINSTTLLSKTV